ARGAHGGTGLGQRRARTPARHPGDRAPLREPDPPGGFGGRASRTAARALSRRHVRRRARSTGCLGTWHWTAGLGR
ncbi:hypothetical protein, partial [Streptomyces diastatochromogenes]|uniref:hypothetical protein n=1 Tax=Streptomyces diastatochromogenes TaxID=42236 RepID=UPI0036B2A6CE